MGAKPELGNQESPTATCTAGDTERDHRAPATAWVSETQESRCGNELLHRRTARQPSFIHPTADGDATKGRAQDCGSSGESKQHFRTETRVAGWEEIGRASCRKR